MASSNNGTATPGPSEDPSSPTPTPSSPPSNTELPSSPSAPPPPSSDPQSSAPPPASTPNAPSSTPAPPASTPQPPSSRPLQTVTAPSAPPETKVITSVVTPSPTAPGDTPTPSVIYITSIVTPPSTPGESTPAGGLPSSGTASATSGAGLQDLEKSKDSGGLGTPGKTAIAVVVPVVVVAALVIAGILLWRRRKSKKNAEEARRKEVEEYGFNPNNDPTLPAVGMGSEMAEDQSGYRGWGNTTTSSNRKASTTLTSGMTGYSDSNSNPGGYQSPGSPTQAHSDSQSNDALMNGRRETLDSEGIGALGAAPNASQNQSNIHRGPSNASSSYSAANRSDHSGSGDYPIPMNNPQDYYDSNNNYYHASPYGGDPYGGSQQPVIRDVSARRNTRIENPSVFPQQGNSGIAQNF